MNPSILMHYFSCSVAIVVSFYNRISETFRLRLCIEHQRPVFITSPRHYGKTSFTLYVSAGLEHLAEKTGGKNSVIFIQSALNC